MSLSLRTTALLLVWACTSPSLARAHKEVPVTLSWRAPESCPDQQSIEALTVAYLGGPLESAHEVRADAYAVATGASFHLHLDLIIHGTVGVRDIDAASCEDAARALALILAYALNPPHDPPSLSEVAPTHSSWEFGIAASFAMNAGALPHVAPGFLVEARGEWRRFGFHVGANYFGSADAHIDAASEIGGEFSRAAGLLRVSYRFGDSWLRVLPFLGLELGVLAGTGIGVQLPLSAHRLWFAPVAGIGIQVPLLEFFDLELATYAEFPHERAQFEVEGVGAIYGVNRICAVWQVGLSWSIL